MAEITENADCRITKVCHWTEDADGIWEGTCGVIWFFEYEKTPKDNKMNYCPKCGAVLMEHTYYD